MGLYIKNGSSSLLNVSGSLAGAADCCCGACAGYDTDFYLYLCPPDVGSVGCLHTDWIDTAINIGVIGSVYPTPITNSLTGKTCTSIPYKMGCVGFPSYQLCTTDVELVSPSLAVTWSWTGSGPTGYTATFNLFATWNFEDCGATPYSQLTQVIQSTSAGGCTSSALFSGRYETNVARFNVIDPDCSRTDGLDVADASGDWWIAPLADLPAC